MALINKSTAGNKPPERLSKKEFARQFRHEAYLRAKKFRQTDPRQIALKEAQKEYQREAYQQAKKRNKAYRDAIKKPGMNGPGRRPLEVVEGLKKRSGRIS